MPALKSVVSLLLLVIVKKQKSQTTNNNQPGFTLIELMVAISIVAILAAVGLVVYSTAQKSARISKRVQDLKAVQTALETYKSIVGSYPIHATGACAQTSLSGLAPNYMPILPGDPLTNCYWYMSNASGTEFKLRTADNSDMGAPEYATQPSLIDPARDGGVNSCTVETGAAATAWAVYTLGGCTY